MRTAVVIALGALVTSDIAVAASSSLSTVSSDPCTNATSRHATEVDLHLGQNRH